MIRLVALVLAACLLGMVCCSAAFAQTATTTFTPKTDITATLKQLMATGGSSTGSGSPYTIEIPAGTYYVSATLTWPSTTPLRIVGAGKYETTLIWGTDLGSGAYAIDANPAGTFPIDLEDITVSGPNLNNNGSASLGLAPAQMSGVHATSCAEIKQCVIGGFYAGIVVDGSHHIVSECMVGNNYYGLYWIKSSTNAYQDDYVGLSDLTGNRFCSVACDPVAMISCVFKRDHTGFEPFCFYREPGVTSSTASWISGSHFIVCQMEGCGYCDFYDASGASDICNNVFEDCGGYGTTYGFTIPAANTSETLPPVGCAATIAGRFLNNTVIGYGPMPGSMSLNGLLNNRWIVPGVAREYQLGNLVPPVVSNTNQVYNNVIQDGDATLTLEPAASAIAINEAVEVTAASAGVFNVGPAKGNAPVLGVAILATAAGQCAPIIARGPCFVATTSSLKSFASNTPVDATGVGTLSTSGGVLLGNCLGIATGGVNVWVNSVMSP